MMRAFVLACALVLVLAAVPATGHAFSNTFELWLGSGSGDFKTPGVDADVDAGEFGMSFTHYFDDITMGSGPLGERVFLQHPSELFVELSGFATEVTMGPVNMEIGTGTFGIGGTYYFPNKRTGLGLALESEGSESELSVGGFITDKEEESIGASRLYVHHYVADAVLVGLSLNSQASEVKETFPGSGTTSEYDQSMFEVYAEALLDNRFKLGLSIAGGEREYTFPSPSVTSDVTEVAFLAGVYFTDTTGLFLTVASFKEEVNDFESTDSTTALTLDHYFTETFHGALSLMGMHSEETDAGTTTEVDVSMLRFLIGFDF